MTCCLSEKEAEGHQVSTLPLLSGLSGKRAGVWPPKCMETCVYVCVQIVLRCHTHFCLRQPSFEGLLLLFFFECSLLSTSVAGWEEGTEAGPGVFEEEGLWRSGRSQVGSPLRPVKGRQKPGVGQRALDQTGPATDNNGGLRVQFHFRSSFSHCMASGRQDALVDSG